MSWWRTRRRGWGGSDGVVGMWRVREHDTDDMSISMSMSVGMGMTNRWIF